MAQARAAAHEALGPIPKAQRPMLDHWNASLRRCSFQKPPISRLLVVPRPVFSPWQCARCCQDAGGWRHQHQSLRYGLRRSFVMVKKRPKRTAQGSRTSEYYRNLEARRPKRGASYYRQRRLRRKERDRLSWSDFCATAKGGAGDSSRTCGQARSDAQPHRGVS